MRKLLATICVLAGTAAADPPARPGRQVPQCRPPSGPVLVEVARIKAMHPAERQVTTIHTNGTWATNDTPPDKGCVPPDELRRLTADLANAPWSVKRLPVHCMAMSLIHTEYRYKGRLVWSERMCSGEELDKQSDAVIQEIDQLVQTLDPNRAPLK